MKRCKDCPVFEYINPMPEKLSFCNGYCHALSPPWEAFPVNGEWDEDNCPILQDDISFFENRYHKQIYEQLQSMGEVE